MEQNATGNAVGLNFYPAGSAAANNQELFDLIGNSLLIPNSGGSSGDVALELLDTDGTTVLATGSDVSENFDLGILDFVVPADGIYTVRVSSETVGDYGMVITDPLVFDTEENEPASTPLRSLDNVDGALGFLSDNRVGGDIDLSLLNSFESMDVFDSGFIPPDPIIAGAASLSVGDTFSSTTDGSVLTVTGVDLGIGEVAFSVEHVYADDGPAPGNGTASDSQ